MSSATRDNFAHLAKSEKPRRRMPRWFFYLFVVPLMAVGGLFVMLFVVALYQILTMTPEQSAQWEKERSEERAQAAKVNEEQLLESAAASRAIITLKADVIACDSVVALEAERDASSDACVVLPKGTQVEFAADAFGHDGNFWWLRTAAGSDNGPFGARAVSKNDAQFDVQELPRLDEGQFRVWARDYGDDWPFTAFTMGVVSCRVEQVGTYNGEPVVRPMVTIKLDDKTYGLNGAALGVGGYADHRVWRKRNEWGYFGAGVSAVSDWIDRSLDMCWR
jgi:hypothetical protein